MASARNFIFRYSVYIYSACSDGRMGRDGARRCCIYAGKVHMNCRKRFHLMSAGAAILGIALCVPAAMLAQTTEQPQDSNAAQTGSQSGMSMHHHRPSAKRQLKRMTKMLSLTADQQQQMLPILQDQQSKMMAMHNDTSMSPDQRREQRKTLMMDTHQKLEAIMTDSQKQQFEEHMQQRHSRMHHGSMGQGSGAEGNPPPPDSGTPPPSPQQ